jgi:hypothetical protein
MTEKEMLERISLAYEVYAKEVGNRGAIENFISWLYKQYGIVQNDKK